MKRVIPNDESCRDATIRILVVADSAIGLNANFGVGKAIEAIRAHSPSYVKIAVDLARRDQLGNHLDTFAVNPAANQANLIAKYRGLRFDHTQSGARTSDPAQQLLSEYDQVWVFGFAPVGDRSPALDEDELRALTRWMDERNGGVFATGVADTLGAALAMRIPRVSTMRRWTRSGKSPLNASVSLSTMPHPVLFGGADLALMDGLHEYAHDGWVYEDAEVELGRSTLTGKAEYPSLGAVRETPHAISWAKGQPDARAGELQGLRKTAGAALEPRVALLGVYDGHASGVGRVVVDSIWHHWTDINLLGLEAAAATATAELATLTDKRARSAAQKAIANYEKTIRYFINIAIWLAPPNQQRSMLPRGCGELLSTVA